MADQTTSSATPAEQASVTAAPASPPSLVVARAGRYYRNARYLMVLLFLGFGIACIKDGFFVYPQKNAEAIARGQLPPHGPPNATYDVPLNRGLGILLPPLAIATLAWTLYRSRGEYRLENNVIRVPGHPPIPLDAIRRIDKRLWEKKGIAYIDYELARGGAGQFKLDDFVYQREPTDRILERIEQHALALAGGATPPA